MKKPLPKYPKWKSIISICCVLSLFAGMVPSVAAVGIDDHVVSNTVTPSGIVLNLFDYWVTNNRKDPDTSTGDDYSNRGINNGHYLKFSSSGLGNQDNSINKWIGSSTPRSGIVAPQLSGGYPELMAGKVYDGNGNTTEKQSLEYLFDKSEPTGKKTFWNVQGLLQVDDDGYYYYNADSKKLWGTDHKGYQTANYAVFDENANSFKLYDTWGVVAAGGNNIAQGQFFPFTDASKVFTDSGTGLSSSIKSDDPALNHYFGMSMTTRFVQRYKGMTSEDSTAKPMTFEFAGDDDVWLFIDGVLVSDLGGIHNQATTSINFSNGDITVNGKPAGTLKGKMSRYYPDEGTWRGNTFADDTYHTMKLFYLERGGTDSNLAMKFNLAHVPETEGVKIDQYGNPLSGVDFTLYAAKSAEGSEGSETGYVVDTTKGVKKDGVLARGQTGADGRFVLNDGSDATISLNELHQQGIKHLLLRENGDRTGYQPMRDIYLHLEDYDGDLLLLNDINHQWQTGSYAQPKETVYANPNIKLRDAVGQPIPNSGIDISAPDSGLMFAVIMRRLDGVGDHSPAAEDHWGIVSGNALDGWNIIKPDSSGYIPAVLDMIKNLPNTSQNYFVFTPCSNGSYMTELDNCPGDMRNYYFWLKEKKPGNLDDAAYTIAYYYTSAESLDQAKPENTHEVYSKDFERQFTATIYVPNVRNYLHVQKTDTEGNPLPDAEFSLYKSEDVIVSGGTKESPELTYTLKKGAEPYDTVTTSNYGMADFPSTGHDLAEGEYYLVETAAPEGCRVNPTFTPIIVNEDGVLADAGTADNGVSVSLYAGTLVRSMAQYALSDGIDRTLTDVVATKLTCPSGQLDLNATKVTSRLTVDKEYYKKSGILRYKALDPNEYDQSWVTNTGWSWFRMQQDYNGPSDGENSTSHKRNLGETDITPLFAGETTVIVQDQPVGSLTIGKTVAAEAGSEPPDLNRVFSFHFTLESKKAPLPDTLTLAGGSIADDVEKPADKEFHLTEDDHDYYSYTDIVTLKHGQTFTISDLPVGTVCRVEEDANRLDETAWKTTVNGAATHVFNAEIEERGQHLTADFTNTYGNYTPYKPVTVNDAIKVTKTYDDDSDLYTGKVKFTAARGDGAPTPEHTEVKISGGDTGSFGRITFEAAGTYTYTVSEVNDGVSGMTYDPSQYTVTFTVVENADPRELRVENVAYGQVGASTTAQQPEQPVADVPADAPEVEQPETSAEAPAKQPAENPAETPKAEQPETPQEESGVPAMEPSADDAAEQVLTGESLQAESAPLYSKETGFTFVNHYKTPVVIPSEAKITDEFVVSKVYTSVDTYNGPVTFTVTPLGTAPVPEKTSVTISGGGRADFGSVTFSDPGKYTYEIRETAGDVTNMTYDSTVYTVTVIVTRPTATSPLYAAVSHLANGGAYSYRTDTGMVFRNSYAKPAEVTTGALKISKTVSGSGADQNAEFQFRVRVGELDGTYGGVAFTKGEATVSVKAGSSVTISGLPAGTAYEVTELSASGYTVTSQNASGQIPAGETVTAAFLNEKQGSSSGGSSSGGSDTPALNRDEHYAYIIGYKDGLLRPNGNISRGEVATIFFRLLRDQVRTEYWSQTNAYSDVPAELWCNNAISTLSNMGIISGYSNGTFRPSAPITRAELTKIAAGFFADNRVTSHYDGRFSDVSGSEWFVSALEKAIEEGIVEGYGDSSFAPDQYITRAQACTIINRTLGRTPVADALLPASQMLTWPDCQPAAWYYAQMQEATNSHDYVWTTDASGKKEKWTKKLADRDWAALEHTWSNANSATGGEAMK